MFIESWRTIRRSKGSTADAAIGGPGD